MKDYLTFRKMIATVAIQVIFWISCAIFIILGIYLMTRKEASFNYLGVSSEGTPTSYIFGGLIVIIGGIIYSRLMSEFYIVIFRIYETLRDIHAGGAAGTFVPGPAGGGVPSGQTQAAGQYAQGTMPAQPVVSSAVQPGVADAPTTVLVPGVCPACSTSNDPGQKFCTNCGAQL